MIEDYNIKDRSSSTNYSIGKFILKVRETIPRMKFLIGVSTKLVKDGTIDAQNYIEEMINYTQKDYNTSWGANPSLPSPAKFEYIEVGNEPGLVQEVAPKDTIEIIKKYAKGANKADPTIKVIGPTTIHNNINTYLKEVIIGAGDSLDIVDIHNYTDSPKDYKRDIKIVKDHINRYMHDTSRRKKSQIGISFSEYNSLPPEKRKGTLYDESWGKVVWYSQTMSYFMQEGLQMASLWHANMGTGHSVYTRWGKEAYPIHYAAKFWHDRIDFFKHPRIIKSYNTNSHLLVVPIQMDDKDVIFITNSSPYSEQNASINLLEYSATQKSAIVEILNRELTGEYFQAKTISKGRVDVSKLQYNNPKAIVQSLDNEKTSIQLPKFNIVIDKKNLELDSNNITLTLPAYSVTAITLPK
jgi:hypothetical protein